MTLTNPIRYVPARDGAGTAPAEVPGHSGNRSDINTDIDAVAQSDADIVHPVISFARIRPGEAEQAARYVALNDAIAPYLRAESIDEIYTRVLDRTERACGRAVTRDVLALLWASRRGLTRYELAGIAGRRGNVVARVVAAIGSHLRWHGEAMALSPWLTAPVVMRYLATPDRRRQAHLLIAEYFSGESYTPRSLEEYPWQLHAAAEWETLLQGITRPAYALMLHESCGGDLQYYWNAIAARYDLIAEYEGHVEAFSNNEGQCSGAATLYQLLGEFYDERGNDDMAELLIRRSNAIRRSVLDEARQVPAEVSYNHGLVIEPRAARRIQFLTASTHR